MDFKKPIHISFYTLISLPDKMRPGYDPLKEVPICWGTPSNLTHIDWLGYLLSAYCFYKCVEHTCYFLTIDKKKKEKGFG